MITHKDIEVGDKVLIDWYKFECRIESVYGGQMPYETIWSDWREIVVAIYSGHENCPTKVTDGVEYVLVPLDWLHKIYP